MSSGYIWELDYDQERWGRRGRGGKGCLSERKVEANSLGAGRGASEAIMYRLIDGWWRGVRPESGILLTLSIAVEGNRVLVEVVGGGSGIPTF